MNFKYKIKFFMIIFGYIVSLNFIIFTSEKSERQMIYEEEEQRLLTKDTDRSKKAPLAALLSSQSSVNTRDEQKTGNRIDIYQEVEEELLKK